VFTLRRVTCEELLTLPLAERVKWLREKTGSHDKLAKALGTSRQTIINWERGAQPTRLLHALVEFSGCPPETWRRREAGAASPESTDLRLRSLEATIEAAGKETAKALGALTRAIERLERRLDDEAPGAMEAGR